MKGCCVIVENRIVPDFREICKNHKKYTGWDLLVVHGRGNKNYVQQEVFDLGGYFLDVAEYVRDGNSYNNLLTIKTFWEFMPCENILIFQHDSRLLRYGVEEFMDYEFVGAPIVHEQLPMPCMNGGLSLRKKSKMLQILENQKWDASKGNEDIWFCRELEKIGANLPTKEIARKFSVESIYSLGSMGYHQIEKYLTPLECSNIIHQYD